MINRTEVSRIVREKLDTKSPLLDSEEAKKESVGISDSLLHFWDRKKQLDRTSFERERVYFLARLIEIKNSPADSAKGKVRQNLENNGLFLPDLIELYNEHNKSEKEIIEEIRTFFLNGRGYKVRGWTLTAEEKSAFQDPTIDNVGSMLKTEMIINELREVNNKIDNGKNPFFHLKSLKEYQNASPDTNLGKAVQALSNHGNLLNNTVNSLTQKSKKSKEKILNSLPEYYCNGDIYNIKDKNSPSYQNGEAGNWGEPGIFLLEEDCKEIKQAITNHIIKTVQENPPAWRIVNICTFDADMHEYYTLGATQGYQEWGIMLISKSSPLEYDEEGFLVKQPQKMYEETCFTKEEFQQIKKILGVNNIEKIPFQKNGYQLDERGKVINRKENENNTGKIITITLLVGMMVIIALVIFKKKKK